jgi:hypothetical protein
VVLREVVVLLLVFALLAPALAADQAPQPQAAQERVHPYKRAGLIMIGIGALVSLAAARRVAGVEGPRFQTCVAEAMSAGERNDCLRERAPNPSLTAVGVALIGGGVLIGLQRSPRTPQIEVGRGRLAVVSRVSF